MEARARAEQIVRNDPDDVDFEDDVMVDDLDDL